MPPKKTKERISIPEDETNIAGIGFGEPNEFESDGPKGSDANETEKSVGRGVDSMEGDVIWPQGVCMNGVIDGLSNRANTRKHRSRQKLRTRYNTHSNAMGKAMSGSAFIQSRPRPNFLAVR